MPWRSSIGVGIGVMKAHLQRSSEFEDSARKELKKPVPSLKTSRSYISMLYENSPGFKERLYILFEHLRESGAVGELSVSGIRVISAQEFTAFSDCIS